jgi:phosphotriesterase-related protein
VREFWTELPAAYRYNLQLHRRERTFKDWDCSVEGFEGIRAQDILPLLMARFGFEAFLPFANLIDPFIDRGIGHNFDPANPEDTAFIDRVHARDEAEIRAGRIKPTHLMAVLTTDRSVRGQCRDGLTPEHCVRWPGLGRTLAHEHVFVMQPEALQNYGRVWGERYWVEDVRIADAVAKLAAFRAAGIRTIVDPTAPGLGRNIPRIQRINAEVDLHIVVATGVYAFLELPNFLHYRSADAIAELFVRELREGIDDTGVKAAFLKCAVEEHGVVGDIPKILEAVALAAAETGAPVMVHTNASASTGTIALDALTSRGVDPTRIVVAHAGDSNDLDYLRAIGDTGATLGFDRFNIPHFNRDENRIRTLLVLLDEGYRDRIHLSHDAACFMDFMVGDPNFAEERPSYLHISSQVLPVLLERGVTQEQIDEMLVDNPRRVFASAPAGS